MRHTHVAVWLAIVSACGPGERRGGGGGSGQGPDASIVWIDAYRDDAPPMLTLEDAAPCGQVLVTYRDFMAAHPDMQDGVGIDYGLVQPLLDPMNKPVYAPSGATTTVTGAASFNQWYRDVPGVNLATQAVLPLVEYPPGTFTYDNQMYFPIDGMSFGNEGLSHNYHFTSEIHTTFTYHGGESFQFSGDDDVFVFVNKHLGIDLGGVHDPLTGTIDFDARAAEFGITVGGTYQLDVFHAERHTVASTFKMTTTIDCLVIL